MEADSEATAPAVYSVEVQWPSQGVIAVSDPQNPIEPVTLDDGVHTFIMTIDGIEHELSVEVKNGGAPDAWETLRGLAVGEVETQEEVLRHLANAINVVDSRIHAELEYIEQDAYDPSPRTRPMERLVRLKITGQQEDQAGPSLSLADDQGDLISAYGLGYLQPPRSASLRVYGALRSQASDLVSLDNGHLSGTAQDSTEGSIKVDVVQGPGPIIDDLSELISKYNELVSYLDRHQDLLRPSLQDRVMRPLEERYNSLKELGLKPASSGRLGLSNDFPETVVSGFAQVRETMLSRDGWVPALQKKLEQIQKTGLESFAAELDVEKALSSRRQAWAMLQSITRNIVNGYY
jgi:hypothetical protein